MKKFVILIALLFTPIFVKANITTDFDHDKCELTITGDQTGHEAMVSIYEGTEFKGLKTDTIDNGNFSVKYVLKYEQDTNINIVVTDEDGHNKQEKTNELVPACSLEQENNPEQQGDKVTVEFNSNGGSAVPSVQVEKGSILERPEEPTKDGYTFGGWYVDDEFNYSFDFEGPVEGDFTLFARWIDNDDLKEYTVTDVNGNIVTFTDEEGHDYKLSISDLLSYTKEEIMQMTGVSEEEYDQVIGAIKDAVKQQGELISIFEIEVYEDNAVTNDTTSLHEGPFKIKIKITDEMKKYNTFKLIYLKNDFTLGEVIELTVEGDYLVGTLPHLSTYVLTGSTTSNETIPSTGDNIYYMYGVLAISVIGLVSVIVCLIRKKKEN